MTSQTQAGPASVGRDAPSRLSLQPPCGLPSFPRPRSRPPAVPSSSSTLRDQSTMTIPKSNGHAPTHGVGNNVQHDNDADADIDTETLMSCLTHFSLGCGNDGFPPALPPPPTSALGTREEQRRIYLGPKLSDRATGGPDAGPLIERFSCLFKDREWQSRTRMSAGIQWHTDWRRVSLQDQPKGYRFDVSGLDRSHCALSYDSLLRFSQLIIQGSRRELPHAAGVHRG
jgi:hypothetical protein